MFNNISWFEFIWVIVIVLALYYLYVLAVYFIKQILSSFWYPSEPRGFSSKGIFSDSNPMLSGSNDSQTSHPDSQVEIQFSFIHDLLEDLKSLFANATKTNMIRRELIQAIKSKLSEYPLLKNSDVQHDINQHILVECHDQCGIDMTEPELLEIWKT